MVTELSRLSRSIKDFAEIWDLMRAHNCSFFSLNESFDTTTAAGEMVMYLTGQSIPAEQLPNDFTFGITFDPSHIGPARLETA
jgi:hypothetical protein